VASGGYTQCAYQLPSMLISLSCPYKYQLSLMSEHITNESYVANIRAEVVDVARRMLSGELEYLDGARRLAGLRHEAAVREDDPDFMAFVAIDSETDEFPIGRVRSEWPDDVLQKLQPEIDEATAWARQFGDAACESLIRRFYA
jgi:hypothetical protein